MAKQITIKNNNLDMVAPLFMQYDGQANPQPAYLLIDPRGDEVEVVAEYNPNPGGNSCSLDEFNGFIKSVSCPANVLGSALEEYLNSEGFRHQVMVMVDGDGWADDWDNIARYIEDDLYNLETANIWDGLDWIENDVRFKNSEGEPCGMYSLEMVRGFYGDATEITYENIDKIVMDANNYANYNDLIINLADALEGLIEAMEENK